MVELMQNSINYRSIGANPKDMKILHQDGRHRLGWSFVMRAVRWVETCHTSYVMGFRRITCYLGRLSSG
jgi:hypothetical protein